LALVVPFSVRQGAHAMDFPSSEKGFARDSIKSLKSDGVRESKSLWGLIEASQWRSSQTAGKKCPTFSRGVGCLAFYCLRTEGNVPRSLDMSLNVLREQ